MADKPRRRYFEMPNIDQPDPEPGYQHSSDEFIVPCSDEDGTSARCQFRAPSDLVSWMGDIVNSRKFPFRRDGDLMRYGLYLACIQLSRIEKDVPNLQARLDSSWSILRRRADAASIIEHLDHVSEIILDLQKKKAWGEIAYMLAGEFRYARETVDHEPYWGMRWLDGLTDRFADVQLLAESKLDTINLRPRHTPETPKDDV